MHYVSSRWNFGEVWSYASYSVIVTMYETSFRFSRGWRSSFRLQLECRSPSFSFLFLLYSRLSWCPLLSFSLCISISVSSFVILACRWGSSIPRWTGASWPPSSHLSLSLSVAFSAFSLFLCISLFSSRPLKSRTSRSRLTRFVRFEWVRRNARALIYCKNSHARGKL